MVPSVITLMWLTWDHWPRPPGVTHLALSAFKAMLGETESFYEHFVALVSFIVCVRVGFGFTGDEEGLANSPQM